MAIVKGSNLDFTHGKGKEKRMPWMESLKKRKKSGRTQWRTSLPFPLNPHRSSSLGRVSRAQIPPLSQDPRTGIPHFKTKARTGSESQSLRATNHEPTQKAKRDSNVRIKQQREWKELKKSTAYPLSPDQVLGCV